MKILIFLGVVTFLGVSLIEADHRILQPDDASYLIHSTGIHVPLNRIILVKTRESIGAFKFISYQEKEAQYEWYYSLDKSIKQGNGKLKDRYWTLIGRFSFQFGEMEIKVGPLKLDWTGFNSVSFYRNEEEISNKSVQFAPTNETDISEVDIHDPKLKWYGYDENREVFRIRLEDL